MQKLDTMEAWKKTCKSYELKYRKILKQKENLDKTIKDLRSLNGEITRKNLSVSDISLIQLISEIFSRLSNYVINLLKGGVENMNINLDFAKESLLYIAMCFTGAGSAALTAEKYLVGSILLLIGAGLIIGRSILKKKGYEVKE
jgi:hypothetical protein